MKPIQTPSQMHSVFVVLVVAALLVVAIACETPDQQPASNFAANVAQSPTVLLTYAATAQVAATVNAAATFGAYKATTIADEDNRLNSLRTQAAQTQTQLALTPSNTPGPPTATFTPSPPTDTPGPPAPTPTLILGMVECVPSTSGFPYVEYSCWRGLVNGQIVDVSSGRERIDFANEDPYQGVVFVWSADGSYQTYRTPTKVGGVKISSASGTQITLINWGVGTTSATFVFDLATRQFETQSGTPIPTTPVVP